MEESIPSNDKKKKEPPAQKEVGKLELSAEPVKKRRGLGDKFRHIFGGDFKSASQYVASEVLLPSIRNLILDAGIEGLRNLVNGQGRMNSRRGSNSGYAPRVQYNTPVERSVRQQTHVDPGRNSVDIGQIILATREDADMVLTSMYDIFEKYNFVTVGDLNNMLGYMSTYVDEKWGWSNLVEADIRQVREGYLLYLPHPEPR